MRRVLITGGTGFVGANLARRLLRHGHEVHLLVRKCCQTWRLEGISTDVHVHEVDVEDRDGVRRIVAQVKPDWAFHLAAYGAYPTQTGIDRMAATNLLGCANLLDACADVGVESFVHTGSSSEYGYKKQAPAEDGPLQPNSHYAITKAAASYYCQFTAVQRDLHAVTTRLYSVYGPYEAPTRLIPTLIVRGLQQQLPPLVSPRTARDFVYVDDAVDAIVIAASRIDLPRGSIFNVCSGTQIDLESVVSVARTMLGIAAPPVWSSLQQRPWDTDTWVGSPAAMERATGWRAAIEFEAGFQRTVDWLREDPARVRFYACQIDSGRDV